jgi:hypothetical protein
MSEQNLLLSECGYPHTKSRPFNEAIAELVAMIPSEDQEIKVAEDRIATLEQQLADAQKDADKYRRHVNLIVSENSMPGSRGSAPGHGHTIKGIWDSDNGAKAGKTCAWCAIWHDAIETTALLAKDQE